MGSIYTLWLNVEQKKDVPGTVFKYTAVELDAMAKKHLFSFFSFAFYKMIYSTKQKHCVLKAS